MDKQVTNNCTEWYWKEWTIYKMKFRTKKSFGLTIKTTDLSIDLGKWSFGMWK